MNSLAVRPSPGGDRGSLGACGPEPGGGGLCPLGPVRAPACPDGAVGRVPGREPETGRCLSWPLSFVPPCGQCSDLGFVTVMTAFPPGITVEGTPVAHQRQKTRGRSLHFLPSRAAPRRAVQGGGHAMPAPHGALPQKRRAIRANPRPMRIPGHNLDHDGEGFAL